MTQSVTRTRLVRSIVLLTTMQGGDRSLRNWLRRQKPPSRGRTIPPASQASVTGFTGPTLLAKFLRNAIIKMKTRPARSNHWKSTALHSSLFLRNAVLASWKIRKSDLKFPPITTWRIKTKIFVFPFYVLRKLIQNELPFTPPSSYRIFDWKLNAAADFKVMTFLCPQKYP